MIFHNPPMWWWSFELIRILKKKTPNTHAGTSTTLEGSKKKSNWEIANQNRAENKFWERQRRDDEEGRRKKNLSQSAEKCSRSSLNTMWLEMSWWSPQKKSESRPLSTVAFLESFHFFCLSFSRSLRYFFYASEQSIDEAKSLEKYLSCVRSTDKIRYFSFISFAIYSRCCSG